MGRNKLSRFAITTNLRSSWVISHAITGERISMTAELGSIMDSLRNSSFSDEELSTRLPRNVAPALVSALKAKHLVVDVDEDEVAWAERYVEGVPQLDGVGADPPALLPDRSVYWTAHKFGTEASSRSPLPAEPRPLRIVGFGGCILDFARDEVIREGAARGFAVSIDLFWPDSPRSLPRLLERSRPDILVAQLSYFPNLTRLLDAGPLGSPAERSAGIDRLKRLFSRWIESLAEALPSGCVGIVHNIGPSAISPYGRFEYAVEYNTRRVLAEINEHIDELLRRHPQLVLLDEERLVARYGARELFDDHAFPFGHHGGDFDPRIEIPNQTPSLSRALAAEYLDLHEAVARQGEIKCIVTDLDGTLWPGIAADDGFAWTERDRTATWLHFGLHQALRLLKKRGFLLATCSKGTEEHTLESWRTAAHPLLTTPDDFVIHRINWQRKSENIRWIAKELGFSLSSILFLDDNPVERFEVSRTLPDVHVIDAEVHRFRQCLLTMPALDRPPAGAEASNRTETTRAMLARRQFAEEVDLADLIAELNVELRVSAADRGDLNRAAELFQRTNQFTTTAWRPDVRKLETLLRSGEGGIFICHVRDRFADYGLTGALALHRGMIECVAISCRVIGLDVGPAFVAASLRLAGLVDGMPRAKYQPTGRNSAASELFVRCGFRRTEDGLFQLMRGADLVRLDTLPHQITLDIDSQGKEKERT